MISGCLAQPIQRRANLCDPGTDIVGQHDTQTVQRLGMGQSGIRLSLRQGEQAGQALQDETNVRIDDRIT